MYAPDAHESLCLFTAAAGLLEGDFTFHVVVMWRKYKTGAELTKLCLVHLDS